MAFLLKNRLELIHALLGQGPVNTGEEVAEIQDVGRIVRHANSLSRERRINQRGGSSNSGTGSTLRSGLWIGLGRVRPPCLNLLCLSQKPPFRAVLIWVDSQLACGTVHQPTWWTLAEDVRKWLLSGEDLWIPDLEHPLVPDILDPYDYAA